MLQRHKRHWLIPLLLLALIALVIWLSPEERTLGARIKIVYIHVAFTWAGLLGIFAAAVLSLGVWWPVSARRLERILPIVSFTGALCFTIGFGLSLLASQVNWGGIAWTEPRVIAASRILALILIVQVLTSWLPDVRWRGALYMGLWGFTVWVQAAANHAIHPINPIFSAESSIFAQTVLTLLGLVLLLAAWFMALRYGASSQSRSVGSAYA